MANPHPSCPREGAVVRDTSGGASFAIGDCIGKGGFGRVFRMTCAGGGGRDWPRDLALKWQLRTPGTESEGRLHKQIVHRGVVRCLAAWDDGDSLFAVLEYCANGSLRDLIERGVEHRDATGVNALLESAGPDGRDHFTLLLCDTVSALAFCGRNGIVHCDIKPENILVDGNMNFKLADFGLSSVVDKRGDYGTAEGGARGTLPYMAPEIYAAYERGEKVQFSVWSDAYSLGLTLLQAVRLFTRPILGGVEDARRFHEERKNVEVSDKDHPSGHVRQALRVMLRHSKESRLAAQGVVEMLSDEGVYAASTMQSVTSLFSRLRLDVKVPVPNPAGAGGSRASQPTAPPPTTSASSAAKSLADRRLTSDGAREFWVRNHDANAAQWEWTDFSDCLFAEWAVLEARADELRALLVPAGRNDVPMARLNAAVADHVTLSLGEALARKLGDGATKATVVAARADAPHVPAPAPVLPRAVPSATEHPFVRALRAFHSASFEFKRARTLFEEALADKSATEVEKARSHLSLWVLNDWRWGGPDETKAKERHRAAASASASLLLCAGDECDPVRAFEMGICHYYGIGTERDFDKAHSLFVSSANGGCAAGMYYVGLCLFYEYGVPRDASAAVAQFERAAAMSHFGAMFEFGNCLYFGYGVSRDEARGVALVRSAAVDEGSWRAKEWLESMMDVLKEKGL